jgi:hypothetical protein
MPMPINHDGQHPDQGPVTRKRGGIRLGCGSGESLSHLPRNPTLWSLRLRGVSLWGCPAKAGLLFLHWDRIMLVEPWNDRYVVANPEKQEFNELKLKEFTGRITKKEIERLKELRKVYE